ncbi:putative RNA-binding Zn-ribbon protein involved in translation (DUF1610 family) [Desulfobaculum xiamenense]|uniref:Putative RNA-binding Zn-ribbon protein involved in translation (DUF1610 family) n=1 Tax=Desulfobaculum xiamenense TaxID=995050 RepID=A0A846QSJ6_9BACT|nr:hypothetical protein [Desulfobaculum xiamenense]NJB68415.1 putative RNA-binding Zn-ribbon protein involved in translation (DUF1610 family) [Desulfobaculum xiamenense]
MAVMSILVKRHCPNCGEHTYQRFHSCLKERFVSRSHWVCEKCRARVFEDGTCEPPRTEAVSPYSW